MRARVLLLSLLSVGTANAAPPAPPPRGLLQLQDAHELTLLAPYRNAAGPTAVVRWAEGSFAFWFKRSWHTLDWELSLDVGTLSRDEPPINPNISIATLRDACLVRVTQAPAGWPFVASDRHWFHRDDLSEQLAVSTDVIPPWLRRLDQHWAHALLAIAGCGRGGACAPGTSFPANVFADLWNALSPARAETPWWVCRERPVRLHRYGREQDQFLVLHCDGSIPPKSVQRLSLLARPTGAPRPETLPDERDPAAPNGEWVPGVRLMHPRLLWVLHRMALKFPWKAIYIYSGYRPSSEPLTPGTHRSHHADGRALDIMVEGVDNRDLLATCFALRDVGCGYYPNNKFVHVDVRSGGGVWVDQSAPGEPSLFVDGWPGVVERGRVIW
jgi:hypothetical protein